MNSLCNFCHQLITDGAVQTALLFVMTDEFVRSVYYHNRHAGDCWEKECGKFA